MGQREVKDLMLTLARESLLTSPGFGFLTCKMRPASQKSLLV